MSTVAPKVAVEKDGPVTVVAIDRYKALSNYHRMTDTPENLCWPTVACAADLAEAVVRELAPGAATASA